MKMSRLSLICILMLASVSSKSQPSLVWATGFGGATSPYSDFAEAIGVDGSGNVYTTGHVSGTVDLDPGPGVQSYTATDDDIYITKQDVNGNFVWAKAMGAGLQDNGIAIKVETGGDVYVTGQFNGSFDFNPGAGTHILTSNGGYDIFVLKLNAVGNFVWAANLGGFGTDVPFGIESDGSGNVYLTGWFQSTADFDPSASTYDLVGDGWTDIFVCKLGSTGGLIWAEKFGGTDSEVGHALALDASGNIYVTGTFIGTVDFDPGAGTNFISSVSGSQDSFVMKLDNLGNVTWVKTIGDFGDERTWEIKLDAFANMYIVGHFADFQCDMDPSPTGTANLMGIGMTDVFIVKWDVNGNYLWAKAMGGSGYDLGYAIALDAMNNVYTTGYFDAACDFDPGAGVHNISTGGSYDIFVSKLDVAGNFVWAKGFGSTGVEEGFGIATDPANSIYVAGLFRSATDFDPGAGTFTLTPVGTGDGFVMKLDNTTTNIGDQGSVDQVSVFPNPCTSDLHISGIEPGSSLSVMNALGETVITKVNADEKEVLSIDLLPSGVYFLILKNEKGMSTKKFLKTNR